MRVVTKQGALSWEDLIGKEVSFEWSDGWDDFDPRYVVGAIESYAEDPRYPRYYVLEEGGGGYSFWEFETVEVKVYDDVHAR